MEKITFINSDQGFVLPDTTEHRWIMKKDVGYSPVQLLVASIGACGGYVFESILEQSNIDCVIESVACLYERDENKQGKPLKKVEITFFVKADPTQLERAVRASGSINAYCPVMLSLDKDVEVIKHVQVL